MIRKFAYPLAKYVDYFSNKCVKEAIKTLDFGEKASKQQMTDFRLNAFQSLIKHAYSNVPYYQNLFKEYGLTPKDFSSLEDINKIPILTKDNIRQYGGSLLSTQRKTKDLVVSGTGGTTSEPINTIIDRRARALGTYAARRGEMWMGWRPGTPMIKLFGGTLGLPAKTTLRTKLRDFALGEIFLSAYDLSRNNIAEYLRVIDDNSPCIIKGYASALYNLALFAEEINYRPKNIISLFATAELLPDQWGIKISKVFNSPVKCYYGCGEVNSLGFQIDQFGPYLVPDEHVIIESGSVKNDRNLACDNSLLLTPLFNYAQPLIRYQVGDIGEVNPPGTHHQTRSTITNLQGRTSDMLVREDGSFVSPYLGQAIIAHAAIKVKKFQFIQTNLHTIEFLYEPIHVDISETDKQMLETIFRTYISREINFIFIKSDKFELSRNNKMRVIISKV